MIAGMAVEWLPAAARQQMAVVRREKGVRRDEPIDCRRFEGIRDS
jgi:hypothetical protein